MELYDHKIQVIAENLSTEEIQGLKQMFTNIDTDNSGTITYEELKDGLARLGSKLTEAEVKQLMEAVSANYPITHFNHFCIIYHCIELFSNYQRLSIFLG